MPCFGSAGVLTAIRETMRERLLNHSPGRALTAVHYPAVSVCSGGRTTPSVKNTVRRPLHSLSCAAEG